MRRLVIAMRALGATACLAAVVAAVPLLLVQHVGWPLPSTVPDPALLWDSIIVGNIPTDVVVKLLACVVWITWAQITWSVLVEGVASARGSAAARSRFVAGPIQVNVAKLVASVVLVATLLPRFSPAPASAMPLALAIPATATTSAVPQSAQPAAPTPTQAAVGPESPATPAGHRWVVQRGDTLWDIARVTLGDPERWREIYDLNKAVVQADGRTFTDPGVLEKGWILQLPSDATSPPPLPVSLGTPPNDAYVVQKGDSLWKIASEQLGDPHRYPEIFEANKGAPQTDGRSLTSPSVLEPGWTLQLPTSHAPDTTANLSPTVTVHPAPDPAPPATRDKVATESAPPVMTVLEQDPPPPLGSSPPALEEGETPRMRYIGPAPSEMFPPSTMDTRASEADTATDPAATHGLLGLAGGIIAVGAMAAIRRTRLAQSVRRPPGTRSPSITEPTLDVLKELASHEQRSPVEEIVNLLRSLGCGTTAEQVPEPLAIWVDDDGISLALARPASPIPGWTATRDQRVWTHPRARTLPTVSRANPAPSLVTIGGTSDHPLLLNLEAAGVVSITGEAEAPADLVRSMIQELDNSPVGGRSRVLVHGIDAPSTPADGSVVIVDDLDAALAELRAEADAWSSPGTSLASAFSARLTDDAPDGAPPLIVVTSAAGEAVARTARRLPLGSSVALIVLGELDAPALEVRLVDGYVEVPELGLRAQAQQLTSHDASRLVEAIESAVEAPVPADADEPIAAALLQVLPLDAPVPEPEPAPVIDLRSHRRESTPVDVPDPSYALCVRMLGRVDAVGMDPPPTPQQTAVLAYLLTHPKASSEAITEALWRDDQRKPDRLYNLMYQLRRAVGPDVLSQNRAGPITLGPGLTSDVDLFEARVLAATGRDATEAMALLLSALDLVRGQPFEATPRTNRYYSWVDLENIRSEWEQKIGDVAHRVAAWAHANGDASTSIHAARKGLLASPLNETLTCDLVRGLELAGDRAAAKSAFDAYDRSLETLDLGSPGNDLLRLVELLDRPAHWVEIESQPAAGDSARPS